MGVLILPSRTLWKPPVGSQIDWGHELADRLAICSPMNEAGGKVVTNLVNGAQATVAGGDATTLVHTITPDGLVLNLPIDCYLEWAWNSADNIKNDFTVVWRTCVYTGGNNYRRICQTSDWGIEQRISDADPTLKLVHYGVADYASGLTCTVNEVANWAVKVTGGSVYYYKNRATSSVGITTPDGSMSTFRLGLTAPYGHAGYVTYFYVWHRPLTASEIYEVMAAPYCFIKPVVRRFYSIPLGVLSSTKYPTLGSDDDSEGSLAWQNPTNIYSDDGNYASVIVSQFKNGAITHRLKAQHFDFDIPSGATINGIMVEIAKYGTGGTPQDYRVELLDGTGSLIGGADNKAETGITWDTSETIHEYGGADDDWNAGLDDTDINDDDFGVVLVATNPDSSASDIFVDYIRITVYYTVGAVTLELRSSTEPDARIALETGISLAFKSSTDTDARLSVSTAINVAGKAYAETRAAIAFDTEVSIALRSSTDTDARLTLTVAEVTLLELRSFSETRADIALDSVIGLVVRSASDTRADISLQTGTGLELKSVISTRADILIDTLISLAFRSSSQTRASISIEVTPALSLRSSSDTRAVLSIETAIVLAFKSSTDTRADITIEVIPQLSLRSSTDTRAGIDLTTIVGLALTSLSDTRAVIVLATISQLNLQSSTDTRTDLLLDSLVGLELRSTGSTRANISLITITSMVLYSDGSTRTNIALLTLVSLALISSSNTRAAIVLTITGIAITLELKSYTLTRAALVLITIIRHQDIIMEIYGRTLTMSISERELVTSLYSRTMSDFEVRQDE